MSISAPGVGLAPLAGLGPVLDDAVALARDGALAGVDVTTLADTLVAVRAAQARLEWLALAVTREVAVSGAHVTDGALTPGAWLRQTARMSHHEAADAVRTARALHCGLLEATSAALAAGEIDPAAARIIAAAAADAPADAVALIEPHALAYARACAPREVAAVMRRFTEALGDDAAKEEAAARRFEKRGLSAATTLDGMLAGRFTLDPLAGSTLLTALDAAAPLTPRDTRTPAQRRADGLHTLASHFLATADTPRTGGARPHVILTQLRPRPSGATEPPSGSGGLSGPVADALSAALEEALSADGPRLSWIGPVTPATAGRAACDANVTVVGVDPDGAVTDLARQRRFFTWTQLTAIIARDGDTCPWPWCDRPIAWSHGHHLTPWSAGGPTTVANGALPCEGHHVLLHEGGWDLQRLPDGRYQARHRRTGRIIGPEPHRRPRGTRPPPHRRE